MGNSNSLLMHLSNKLIYKQIIIIGLSYNNTGLASQYSLYQGHSESNS